jgi:hypothetical protein
LDNKQAKTVLMICKNVNEVLTKCLAKYLFTSNENIEQIWAMGVCGGGVDHGLSGLKDFTDLPS